MTDSQQRQCGEKRIYPEECFAARAADEMKRKTQVLFGSYRCPWCNGWHIGRSRTPEQARRR